MDGNSWEELCQAVYKKNIQTTRKWFPPQVIGGLKALF
jgi:hypothetical protein